MSAEPERSFPFAHSSHLSSVSSVAAAAAAAAAAATASVDRAFPSRRAAPAAAGPAGANTSFAPPRESSSRGHWRDPAEPLAPRERQGRGHEPRHEYRHDYRHENRHANRHEYRHDYGHASGRADGHDSWRAQRDWGARAGGGLAAGEEPARRWDAREGADWRNVDARTEPRARGGGGEGGSGRWRGGSESSASVEGAGGPHAGAMILPRGSSTASTSTGSAVTSSMRGGGGGGGSSAHLSHLDAALVSLIGPAAAAAFAADVHAMGWPAALHAPRPATHGGAGADGGEGGESDADSSTAAASAAAAAQLPSNTTGPTTASGSNSNSSAAGNSGVSNGGSSGRGGGQRPSSRRPSAQIRIDRIPADTSAATVAAFVRDTLRVTVDRVKIKGYTRIRALPVGRATAGAGVGGGAAGAAGAAAGAGEGVVVGGTRYREEWVSAGYGYADFLTAEVAEFVMQREEALVLKGQQLGLQRTMEQRRAPEGLLFHATVHLGFVQQPAQLALTWRSKPESCRVEFDFLERRVRVVVQEKAGARGRGGAGWGRRAAEAAGGAKEDAGGSFPAAGASLLSIPLAFQRVEYKLEWRMRDVRLWGTKDSTTRDTDGPGLTSSLLLLLFVPPAVFSRASDDDVWQLEPDSWFPDDGDPWTRTTDEHFLPAGGRAGAGASAAADAYAGVGDDGGGGSAGAGRWDGRAGSDGSSGGGSGWKGRVWSGGVLGAASVMQVSVPVRRGSLVRRIAAHMRTASLHLRARYLGDPQRVAITTRYAAAPPIHLAPFISLDPSCLPITAATTAPDSTNTKTASSSGSSGGSRSAVPVVLAFPVLYLLTALVQQGTIPPTAVTASLYRTLAYEPVPAAVAVLIEFFRFSRPEFHPSRKFRQIARAMRHHGKLQAREGTDKGWAKEPEGTGEKRSERGAEQQGSAIGELERQQQQPQQQPQPQQEHRGTEEKAGEGGEGESSTWPWKLPANHVLVFRLLITPLGAQCCMPGVELTNRVLTHYRAHAHRFLRVTFTDEGLENLPSFALMDTAGRREGGAGHTDVYCRILCLVEEGLSLCGRHYCFLASSASQLREKSAWFLAEDDALGLSVASVQVGAVMRCTQGREDARKWPGAWWCLPILPLVFRTAVFGAVVYASAPRLLPPPLPPRPHPRSCLSFSESPSPPALSFSLHLGACWCMLVRMGFCGERHEGGGWGGGRGEQQHQAWMGTFSAIRNVAKCAARMGQCFSSRFTSLPLPRAHVRKLPDVTRNAFCFTDGVGAVSPEVGMALADAIAPYLDRPVGDGWSEADSGMCGGEVDVGGGGESGGSSGGDAGGGAAEGSSGDKKESGSGNEESGNENDKESGSGNVKESGKRNDKESGSGNAKESGSENEKESGMGNEKESGSGNKKESGSENEKDTGSGSVKENGSANEKDSGSGSPKENGSEKESGSGNTKDSGGANANESGSGAGSSGTKGKKGSAVEQGRALLRAPSAFQIRYAGVKGVITVWPRWVMQQVEHEAELHRQPGSNGSNGSSGSRGASAMGGADINGVQQGQVENLMFREGDYATDSWMHAGEGACASGSGGAHMDGAAGNDACPGLAAEREGSAAEREGSAASAAGAGAAAVAHMWIRPSMDKFESQHADVEVVNWTRPLPCFLNRQIITLLATMGVQDHVFLHMQDAMLQQLDRALSEREAALQLLEESCADDLYNVAMTMLSAGFQPHREPHLKRMMRAVRSLQLQGLISKARIFVKHGRWLMGVVDETGLLEYGQCFIRVCDTTAPISLSTAATSSPEAPILAPTVHSTGRGLGAPQVITGPIVFGKNPCLHPGDLRVLTAVDVPCLHHLVDCLVLPKKGPRPHADEASGSDMDGDVYFVTWDARLMPPSGRSSDPMDYQPVKKEGKTAVTMKDVHRFFVDHMLNDSVGIICNAHVVHADRSAQQASDPACMRLAREAAIAFDFCKTGVAGQMPRDLRVQEYPDFMEKGASKETYESDKVLGRLYREVKDTAVVHEDDDLPRVVPAVAEEEGAGGEEMAQERREREEEVARVVREGREVREGAGESMGWEGEVAVLEDGRMWLRWPGVDEVGRAYREDLRVEGYEQHVQEARALKWAYDRSMLHILHQVGTRWAPGRRQHGMCLSMYVTMCALHPRCEQFGIMTEAEVASGSMLQAAQHNGRKDDAVREHVRNMYVNLRRHYHRLLVCGADHGRGEDDDDDDDSSDTSSPAARTKQQQRRQQQKDPRLRVTSKVNVVQGIKAMLPDDAPTARKPGAEAMEEATRLDNATVRARAFAWYHVCYHPSELQRVQQEARGFGLSVAPVFLSFAWIGVDILCQHLITD
ncbi:unnamed protein product [Closterium sp. NIES-54]